MTFDPKLPLALATTLPTEYYRDTDNARRIDDAAFKTTWQYIGPLDLLSKSGDYITANILNNPLVFVRDEGHIRGFHNVCRHHAATLLCGRGNCAKIRCQYHGWTYGLDGSLKGVPEFKGVENFKEEDYGLHKVQTQAIGPFLFACISPRWDRPLMPMGERDDALLCKGWEPKYTIPSYKYIARKSYDLACNWKVYVDNYLDGGYHVNTIHPELAANIHYQRYHNELHEKAVLQVAPLKDSEKKDNRSGGEAYYWWFFPNFMLNMYGDMMDVNHVEPTGPTTCRVTMDFYAANHVPAYDINRSIEISHKIQDEDVDICERVQKGLGSDAYEHGRYSVIREGGMYLFHQLLTGQSKW